MPAAPFPASELPAMHAGRRRGSNARPRRTHVPHALALKPEVEVYSRRQSVSTAPVIYSFLPSASPGAGWTISPTSSASPTTPAPVSLFAAAAVSPAVHARRPSAPRVRRADGDAAIRPAMESSRLHFPLPPSSPPRPPSARRPSLPASHPLAPTEPPSGRPFTPVAVSRASLAQVVQPPLPIRSATMEETQMYDDLKTFVFGAASVSHDVDMDDAASDAASAYNPLSPPLRPDGFASTSARRPSKSAPRRSSRAGLRDGAPINAGKRRNSRAWIPADSTVARPEIAVTSVPRDQDAQDAVDDEDHDGLIRMMERAKMRAIDDGARRPSLPINIPDSGRRSSRDSALRAADSAMDWAKPLPDLSQRRPSGALATAGFDLDFILAAPASYPPANPPAGQGLTQAAGTAMSWDSFQQRRNSAQLAAISPFALPTGSSIGHEIESLDVEDTFLSMCRKLDTEYARRRNKWSFCQEPRRAYDYDLDPDEEVWGCEPVGTFWISKDREAAANPEREGPAPVVIKPLMPHMSPKTQAAERRSDIRISRDEKRPIWKLSVMPTGSPSTVPVKILLATKGTHLKVAATPRTEGRRRGHTVHADSSYEMGALSSSSGELGRIDELPPLPKTSHAVAFDTLTDAEIDHGRRHVSFSERIRRAFGSESPPPPPSTSGTPQPSFSPPWLMMAPQSAKEEQIRQIRELHSAFRAVGLLTPPKSAGKDPNQPHAIKAVRTPSDEMHKHHETPAAILEDIPADALCMTLPLWQFRASANKDDGLGSVASVGRPLSEREYLLVYFVPLGASDASSGPGSAHGSRLSKKRSRGNMDRRSSSVSASASWAKGRRTAFHVVARVLTAAELCATGLRHPSTLSRSDAPSTLARTPSVMHDRKRRAFPSVIAMCNGTGTSVEFVPEGLDRLGLCTPSYEWQSESERFPGLTPVGVEIVEMVWAASVAVLGISA